MNLSSLIAWAGIVVGLVIIGYVLFIHDAQNLSDKTLQAEQTNTYINEKDEYIPETDRDSENINITELQEEEVILAEELDIFRTPTPTPETVQALYMTSWVAGTPSIREPIIDIIDTYPINSIVIDIKDDTGKISFRTQDPFLQSYGSSENRIPNIDDLLARLKDKGVYIIGRISVFQDPFLATQRPDLAVLSITTGEPWKDRKGLSFLHPGKTEVWEYTVALAKEAFDRGFDEINFDYVRFPSDGNIRDIEYNLQAHNTRTGYMREFFAYLHKELDDHPMVTSVDLFGMTTTHNDDLGIGQIWEDALPYFDYIAPMVYPSHYPPTWGGFANPAADPYEVITQALSGAVQKTHDAGYDISKIRTWIQDFNHGAVYTPDMVLDQIRASRNLGIDSWMIWNPSNRYRTTIFEKI